MTKNSQNPKDTLFVIQGVAMNMALGSKLKDDEKTIAMTESLEDADKKKKKRGMSKTDREKAFWDEIKEKNVHG